MTKYPCRCSKCRALKTLSMHPDEYKRNRFKKCWCGGDFVVDTYRRHEEHKKVICKCDGLSFPHRAGSSVWCKQHKTGPTEEDYRSRYGEGN